MRLDVYSIMRNEAPILPYFLRHYETIADRIFVWDDNSNDGTRDMLAAHPKVVMLDYDFDKLNDEQFANLHSTMYKKLSVSADWIACVDADEFVYHPSLTGLLSQTEAEIIVCEGWEMLFDCFPSTIGQVYSEIKEGVQVRLLTKALLFRSSVDIKFLAGRHAFESTVSAMDVGVKLLHFRHLGREYYLARCAKNFSRLSEINLLRNWGWHCKPEHAGKYMQGQVPGRIRVV